MTSFKRLELYDFLPAYSGIDINKNDPYFSYYSDRVPAGVDKEFYPSTFLKREFNQLKLEPFEVSKVPGQPFKPLHQQSFMAKFLSPNTPYDRMLVFHEVGTGKCVSPNTFVWVNNKQIKICDLWDDFYITNIFYDGVGEWGSFIEEMSVKSFCINSGNIISNKVNHVYRQFVNENLYNIFLENGKSIKCTGKHKILSEKFIWVESKNLQNGMLVGTYDDNGVVFSKILSINVEKYKGFVYDLEIDISHNYIANNIITHNTCLSSLVSETAQEQNPNLGETLILVKNEVLQKNFTEEISSICTDNKYIPDEIDPKTGKRITPEQYIRRLNTLFGRNYIIDTFERFAKELASNDDNYIKKVYSNRVIIIDEAHNLRIQPRETAISIYNQIFRLLHLVEGCKVMIMSATPMRDRPIEIASLLNLILPNDSFHQFNLDTFMNDYFIDSVFRENKKDDFKEKIRGIVSYVRSMSSGVKKIYEGTVLKTYMGSKSKGIKKTPLVLAEMSDLQTKSYEKAFQRDKTYTSEYDIEDASEFVEDSKTEQSKSGLYTFSRQAAMFVAPDGSYADDIIPKWFIPSREDIVRKDKRFKRERISIDSKLSKVSSELKNFIFNGKSNPSDNEKLEQLSKLSSKFSGIIREIINNPTEKAFVYSNLVSGSGTNLFAAILELFGFSHVALPESGEVQDFNLSLEKYKNKYKSNDRKHFLLITGNFPTSRQSNFLINKIYNNADNKYGDFIRVIVASKVVGEGSSFKHTRQFHNLTPGWNETETTQAQGRVIRAFSHDIFTDPSEKYIKIFKWCAMPSDKNVESIDFKMYKLSEDKDYPIKQVERLLKEAAVDCAINSKRNMRPNIDVENSRECDYSTCVYKCDDIPVEWYNGDSSVSLNYIDDTYNLYYANEKIDDIKLQITKLFRYRFSYDFSEIEKLIPETRIILIRALKDLIDKSQPILNKYGIQSYIREYKNLYFLIDNQEFRYFQNIFLLSYYNASPMFREDISFRDFTYIFENEYLGDKLEKLSNLDINKLMKMEDGKSYMTKTFNNFDISIQEKLLESFIRANQLDINKNKELRKVFLDIYSKYIFRIDDNTIVSSLLQEEFEKLRCYDIKKDKWYDCTKQQELDFNNIEETMVKPLREKDINPYGFYGIIRDDVFKIVTVRTDVKVAKSTNKPDARIAKKLKGEGQTCGTGAAFSQTKLAYLFLKFGEIAEKNNNPAPSVYEYLTSKEQQFINKNVSANYIFRLLEELKNKIGLKDEEQDIYSEYINNITISDIENFTQDKKIRWFSILNFRSKLCKVLKEWFDAVGLLIKK